MITRAIVVTIFINLSIFNLVFCQVKPAKDLVNVGQQSQKYTLGLRIGGGFTLGHFPKNLPDTILKAHKNRPKTSFSIAGQLSFPLKHDFSCLIEAGYARGGRKVDYNSNEWQNDFTYNFISTSLALRKGFKIPLKGGRYTDVFFNVGPNISYLMGGKMILKTDNGGRTDAKLVYHNLSDSGWAKANYNDLDKYHFNNANRFFFGLDIGAGIFVPVTARQKVFVELRFTLGGTYIRKRKTAAVIGGLIGGVTDPNDPNPNPNIGSFSDPLTTNMRNLALNVAYTFDFDKKNKNKGKSTVKKSNQKRRR